MEVIYGQNPVIEALKAGRRHIEEIYTTREDHQLRTLAGKNKIKLVTKTELDQLSGSRFHQGLAARVGGYPYYDLKELYGLNCVVLLDSVEDPQNLGAIVRSAHALAAAGIVIPTDRAAGVSPAAVKASAGAAECARIARVTNLKAAAKQLKENGFWLVGLEAGNATTLEHVPDFAKLALVMGGEDSGVRPVMVKELDVLARIPMLGEFNSLNVAQSATVALYELVTRRKIA